MTESPIHLSGCVIYNEKREVLLLHRNTPEIVQFEVPGGMVEPNETRAEAAVREAKEEIGVVVRTSGKIGSAPFTQNEIKYRYHWYSAVIEKGEPQVLEPEVHDCLGYYALDPYMDPKTFSVNVINLAVYLKRQEQKQQRSV